MESSFVEHTLSNGLRLVMETMPDVKSAAVGFFAKTGGRDEEHVLAGVSHFLEHMCFKGTSQRTWREINIAFDEMGSSYNAFTSKDRTFYYGWVPTDKIELQLELLADMMRSTLPPDEFDMEKKVVLEEIAMSNDHIDNLAYDFMHEQVFSQHSLAWPVLGYEHTVQAMSSEQMCNYLSHRYAPDNMVLIVTGLIVPRLIIDIAEKLCGAWTVPNGAASWPDRKTPDFRTGKSCKALEKFNRQELLMVYPTPGGEHPLNETADALAAILGGDNSRFYWHIVQEGISPQAGVWRIDYSDCGLMMLSGQCDPKDCESLADAMHTEAAKITKEGVSEEEVQRVKNRRRTSLAVESEAPYYRLGQLLDDIDYRNYPRTVEQRLAEVDAITPRTTAEYLEQYPITEGGHFISVGPRDWVPSD